MKTHVERIITIILSCLILFGSIPSSLSEQEVWNCPNCGRTGNTGNYCGACANPAPWIYEDTPSENNNENESQISDRDDLGENLIELSSDPKYIDIDQTDFNVTYNADGSVLLEGRAEDRAWIEISRLVLTAGNYIFTGFAGISNVPENFVSIELEYYDENQGKYLWLTQSDWIKNEVEFELTDTTHLRALVRLYPGTEGKHIVHPAIYRSK